MRLYQRLQWSDGPYAMSIVVMNASLISLEQVCGPHQRPFFSKKNVNTSAELFTPKVTPHGISSVFSQQKGLAF